MWHSQTSEKASRCSVKFPFLFVLLSFAATQLTTFSGQITGLLLNQSHFICPSCSTAHELFGSPDAFRATADRLGIPVLAELPLVAGVSSGGDKGIPFSLIRDEGEGGRRWKEAMDNAAAQVWQRIHSTG
jgi:ATP-binding protein involved in chromosome partitioning